MTKRRRSARSSIFRFHNVAWWIFFLVGLSFLEIADAHVTAGESGSFISGVKHPLSGVDHIVAMVSVGLWGAQLGRPAIWVLPITFPLVMAIGGFLGLIGVSLPGVEIGIALSAIALGAMVSIAARPSMALATVLVATFAIFHGYSHGAELEPGKNAMLYTLGFILATGLLHGCGIAVGLLHQWSFGQVTLRLAGIVVLTIGVYFLWKAVWQS